MLTGMVDEATKWALFRGARVSVAPSPHESFSLTVVEALTAGVPVVVHAQCGATREHCERSGAGLWFRDSAEFESVLELLTADDVLHARLAANGVGYVDANFRWPVILDRYCAFLDRFTGGGWTGAVATVLVGARRGGVTGRACRSARGGPSRPRAGGGVGRAVWRGGRSG